MMDDQASIAQQLRQQEKVTQAASSSQPKKRKNRLGQMARQRLAEKKYKEQAKHKLNPERDQVRNQDIRKMQAKRQKKRDKSREMGLNAGGPSGPNTAGAGAGRGGYSGGGGTWGSDEVGSKPHFTASVGGDGPGGGSGGGGGGGGGGGALTVIDPSFHPSWVAKAAADAKANQSFAGTKITFDD